MAHTARWGLAKVRGESMAPTLYPGDRLLIRYRRPRDEGPSPGALVLARFPDGTLAVKRMHEARRTASGAAGWWLLSDNPAQGVDSRHRGPLADEAVLGTVVLRVWPRPRWRRLGRPPRL